MIENVPFYVSATFILTTFLTVGIFHYAAKRGAFSSATTRVLSFLLPFWLFFQGVLSVTGFYTAFDARPPRLLVFAVLPAMLAVAALFIFSRKDLIERLPLRTLTWLHTIRVPVELVLLWLFQAGLVPQLMTFEGRNFDILTGLTAPVVAWLAFRGGRVNRPLLIIWNLLGLALLINVVTHAVLALPTPFQQLAFDRPNRGVALFPFVWLPSMIVPVVLFTHLATLWQLLKSKPKP